MFKKEILENQKKILNLDLIKRDFDINEIISVLKLNKIIALIWLRRAWKTFLTFQIAKKLIKKKIINIENIVYIDFSWIIDKDLNLNIIEDSFLSLFPDKKPFFIFDEIQELNNFPEKLINLLNKWYKILITWSNAHLLSKEISTILRWKVYTKEVFPLNFKEYLKFNNTKSSKNDFLLNKPKYKNKFEQFLKWWWLPEIVLVSDVFIKENILKSYFDIMIYKDLQDRYKIKNDFALSFFIKRILTTFSKELSVNKIFNELKSKQIKIWKDSLYNFYEYLNNIYFIENLSNFWTKIKWLKKNYLVDVSFANLIWNNDFWQRFENFVFLSLRKKFSSIYFLSKNYKIDFYIPKKDIYIQVVYNLNMNNIKRETKGLLKQKWEKILVYFDIEEWLKIDDGIRLMNFWEFEEDFWIKKWQKDEIEVNKDIAEGNLVGPFSSVDELFKELKS